MSRAHGERIFAGAVVYGQVDVDFRNADGAHHALAGVEQTLIFLIFGGHRIIRAGSGGLAGIAGKRIFDLADGGLAASHEFLVVLAGGFELVLRLWVRPAIHLALRLLHGGVLLVFADGAHDERRGDDGKPDQHRQHSKHARLCARTTLFCSGAASHWMDSSPLNKRHYPKS